MLHHGRLRNSFCSTHDDLIVPMDLGQMVRITARSARPSGSIPNGRGPARPGDRGAIT
jgi:hypothetical protein